MGRRRDVTELELLSRLRLNLVGLCLFSAIVLFAIAHSAVMAIAMLVGAVGFWFVLGSDWYQRRFLKARAQRAARRDGRV